MTDWHDGVGIVPDLPPLPPSRPTDTKGLCFKADPTAPGYCGLPKGHTGPHSWARP